MQPIIVGGGWSGLAATVHLAEAGQKPILFEAAKQLGGVPAPSNGKISK
ncbi:hypothetical protein Q7A_03225 [Methylophaga nitratireducenticrescens]|nr:hypothetical protein Q7A_03225 [Methylophaga nitratireducenticrescens]